MQRVTLNVYNADFEKLKEGAEWFHGKSVAGTNGTCDFEIPDAYVGDFMTLARAQGARHVEITS